MYATLRRQYSQRHLLVGVDRLDYTKGLPQRLRAFQRLLHDYPENRGSAVLSAGGGAVARERRGLRRHLRTSSRG